MTLQTTLFSTDQPTNDYFNTNGCNGQELAKNKEKAEAQNAKILQIFKTHSDSKLSPHEVKRRYPGTICINSVRRAMSVLKSDKDKDGFPRVPDLLRTNERIETPDNGMEYRLMLNKDKFYK